MRATAMAALTASMLLPSLHAQDPAKGEYRALGVNQSILKQTPLAFVSTTPNGTMIALDKHGNLVQVSAGSETEIWGVNAAHAVFRWTGTTWQTMPGSYQQVVVAKGGGLVMGIEWAEPKRVTRWDPATNAWIPLVNAPRLVELALGSPNHVYGITAAGEIHKLKRPEWTQWARLKGALKHITVSQDGTVGGLGTDGKAFCRTDADVVAEINTPTITPTWTPIDLPPNTQVVYIDLKNAGAAVFIDKFGTPADALISATPGTLKLISSTVTVTGGSTVASLDNFTNLVEVSSNSGEVTTAGCIALKPGEDINLELAKTQNVPVDPTKMSYRCETRTFSKVKAHNCLPRQSHELTMQVGSPGKGCVGTSPTPVAAPGRDPLQIDGKGTDCAPRTFFTRSARSSVSFLLPGGRVGEKVTIGWCGTTSPSPAARPTSGR
jgi:Tectonin domain